MQDLPASRVFEQYLVRYKIKRFFSCRYKKHPRVWPEKIYQEEFYYNVAGEHCRARTIVEHKIWFTAEIFLSKCRQFYTIS